MEIAHETSLFLLWFKLCGRWHSSTYNQFSFA